MKLMFVTEDGLSLCIIDSTKFSGVDAPEIIPIVLFVDIRSSVICSGPFIKSVFAPARSADSFSLLQFELF